MDIKILSAEDFVFDIQKLFKEYTDMLVKEDPSFEKYLEIQNYEEELKDLSKKYGPPFGRLYIVFIDGKAAGCIGLKRLDDCSCEMKRLYVKPEFRSSGIGHQLVNKIIVEAKEIGYSSMRLDTLPFLSSAINLYKSLGFYETAGYNDSPMDSSIYMQLDL